MTFLSLINWDSEVAFISVASFLVEIEGLFLFGFFYSDHVGFVSVWFAHMMVS